MTFIDVQGRRVNATASLGPWTDAPDGRRRRYLFLGETGVPVTQSTIPAPLGRERPSIYDLLENEVRCGVRLAGHFPAAYPIELLRVHGYNVDIDPPFILHGQPRGRPVSTQRGRLFLQAQEAFGISMFWALALLADAGLVHGAIGPDSVRWDGRAVQLCEFGHGALAGEQPMDGQVSAFTSPERRDGTRPAAPADDVWAAAVLLMHITTGRSLPPPGQAPPTTGLVPSLTTALTAVFDAPFAQRPSARDVLELLRVPAIVASGVETSDTKTVQGQHMFDEERIKKAELFRRPPAPVSATAAAPGRIGR